MKALLPIFAAVLLAAWASPARANGVERGDVSIHSDNDIPKGVEDEIETTIFENCDLRGAKVISTSYFQLRKLDAGTVYDIQYTIDFGDENHEVTLYVSALLTFDVDTKSAVQIQRFESSICRKLPDSTNSNP